MASLREAARDLRFTDAGGADHDDVLGHDLLGHVGLQLLPAHAIAQRDGHGSFCVLLADDVLIEFGDDLTWGELVERHLFFFGGCG